MTEVNLDFRFKLKKGIKEKKAKKRHCCFIHDKDFYKLWIRKTTFETSI